MTSPRLLLIDDNPLDIELARVIVADCELSVQLDVMDDPRAALAKLLDEPSRWTLILLDLNMPILDGFDLLEALGEQGIIHHLSLVVFSSSRNFRDWKRALELGAKHYLVKEGNLRSTTLALRQLLLSTMDHNDAEPFDRAN